MRHEQGEFAGVGGLVIRWQAWRAASPRAVVVIAHGLGEHGGRYAELAGLLNGLGATVVAIDHRGHGRSEGPRAYVDRLAHAIEDLHALIGSERAAHPGTPLFLLGHSMGGVIALGYASRYSAGLAGLILSGAAVQPVGAPAVLRPFASLLSALLPRLGVKPVAPALVSVNPANVAAYVADPLVHHGLLPARTIGELIGWGHRLQARLGAISLPVLIQHGTEDALAKADGSRLIHDRIGAGDRSLKLYAGLGHEIYNEAPAARAPVFDDLLGWLRARLPG